MAGRSQEPPALAIETVLERAAAWAGMFQHDLSGVVAEERYEQRERGTPDVVRETGSDLVLLRLEGRSSWLHFRDVFEVNGRPVRDRDDRLRRLFLESPSTALKDAVRLTDESSRYNLGMVLRTINVPTFALIALEPSYRPQFAFEKQSEEHVGGTRTWRVRFVERGGRSIVRTTRGANVPIEGSLWIEPLSGRVVQTMVKTVGTQDPDRREPPSDGTTLMWVVTSYGVDDASGLWVPVSMREWARGPRSRCGGWESSPGRQRTPGFRRFVVTTDEQFPAERR